MIPPGTPPLHELPDTQGFGRVTVGFQGRVMHYIAQGPFDAALMAAAKRGSNIAAERIPADKRYVSLMEFRPPLGMDLEGLREFKETVGGFVERQIAPLATILLVAPCDEEHPMVLAMAAVYRLSRPLFVCTQASDAWTAVNRVLHEAQLPVQPVPPEAA